MRDVTWLFPALTVVIVVALFVAAVRGPGLVLPRRRSIPLGTALAYSGALLSGLLYWLAFAGWDVWPLAFVAFVPLWIAIHRQTPRRALLLGALSGLTMNVAGFYWLQDMLRSFSGFPPALCFVFVLIVCAYQGGRMGLMGWLYARATARGWPGALVFAAAFVASEILYPLLFPWYFAATVHQVPLLTQVADLGGPILVGVVIVGVNLAITEPLLARLEGRARDLATLVAGPAALALTAAYGAWRIGVIDAQVAASEPAKVGLVQANMGLMEKRVDPGDGLRRHMKLTNELKAQDVDFVVWSETSVMQAVQEERHRQLIEANVGRFLGVPGIFGAVLYKPDPDREYVMFNTAMSTDIAGHVNGRYDKELLLAFGEYLPLGETFPILYKWSPNSGHFSAGTELTPLTVVIPAHSTFEDGKVTKTPAVAHPVTMLICYEDILPSFTNRAVAFGKPELLVNMTNDAWFGNTTEPWEHLALAQFRAIEHRRFLVRSTNSGVSAVVDPVGRVLVHSTPFVAQSLSATIRWMQSSTVYEAVRDYPFYVVTIFVVAGAFVKRRERRTKAAA